MLKKNPKKGHSAHGNASIASLASTSTNTTTSSASNARGDTVDQKTNSFESAPTVPAILSDGQPLPRLIVFDLDYTLWPFWIDTHAVPPLKANNTHSLATDKMGETFTFFNEVPSILHGLASLPSDVKLGVASRTYAPELARELLKLLHLPLASTIVPLGGKAAGNKKEKAKKAIEMFDAGLEIYPGSKTQHMEALGTRNKIAFEDMLFFDDESRNRDVERLGVTMCLVNNGMTWRDIERGVAEWRRRSTR